MKTRVGNLLDVTEGLILQQVNCQGQMGSGVARAIYERYPIVKERYCEFAGAPGTQDESGAWFLGASQFIQVSPTLTVGNLYTQQFFGREQKRYTSYDALDNALSDVRLYMIDNNVLDVEVHHPLIGSDLGGGHWDIVEQIIRHRIGPNTTLHVLR